MTWVVRSLRDGLGASSLGEAALALGIVAAVTLVTLFAAARTARRGGI
jgi:hypothetical protein